MIIILGAKVQIYFTNANFFWCTLFGIC